MKPEQAASMTEQTSAKCNSIKYDVEVAEEYIARQVGSIVCILLFYNPVHT